jgi:oligoribonuclease NrnB/cAMP/cGMP phosphodiesterase (DHH superfamily)
MRAEKSQRFVHLVSHGPYCLDGVAAAVAVSRYAVDAHVMPHFSSNAKINDTLLGIRCEPADAEHELWITDISWTDPRVDVHLQQLLDRGVRVYWIDHHRSALERYRRGEVTVRFTDVVLSEAYAAARLTYEYLRRRLQEAGGTNARLEALQRLIAMADDNDRWLHQIPGSRRLASTVAALHGDEAYAALLDIDAEVTYTPAMQAAARRAEAERQHSFAVAAGSRVAHRLDGGVTLIAAVCDGYASDIADSWGQSETNAVFAFFDTQSLGVSLRRSPDCEVDLSRLAERLGGGGHAAAAGCELPVLRRTIADALHAALVPAFEAGRGAREPREG